MDGEWLSWANAELLDQGEVLCCGRARRQVGSKPRAKIYADHPDYRDEWHL